LRFYVSNHPLGRGPVDHRHLDLGEDHAVQGAVVGGALQQLRVKATLPHLLRDAPHKTTFTYAGAAFDDQNPPRVRGDDLIVEGAVAHPLPFLGRGWCAG